MGIRHINERDAWVTNADGDIIGIQLHGRSEMVDLRNPVNADVNELTGMVINFPEQDRNFATLNRAPNSRMCLIGDSIGDMNTDVTASVSQYAAYGFMCWALLATDWGFYFDDSLNFAKSGATLDGAGGTIDGRTQVAQAISSDADNVFLLLGTNSLVQATTATEMFTLLRDSYIVPLLKAGKRVFTSTLLPRDGLSAANLKKMQQFNRLVLNFGAVNGTLNGNSPIIVVGGRKWEDCAHATAGNCVSGVIWDAVAPYTHPTPTGAYLYGYEDIGDELKKFFPSQFKPVSPSDVYDASSNVTGSLFSNPALKGTAGNKPASGGITASGNVADSCRLYRGTGTSTATLAGSKTAPLLSGYTGSWQRIQVAISVAGSATETYVFSPDAAIALPEGVVPGDKVQLEAQVWVSSHAGLIGLEAQMVENGPSIPQQSLSMVRQSGQVMPFPTGKLVTLKTHPIVLQEGVTSLSGYVRAVLNGTSTSSAVDWYVVSYTPRKIV